FKIFTGNADVYVFFIEKGFQIIKEQGVLTYIMPNKFMQAGYGQPVRKLLSKQNLIEIIDFGDIQIFEEATTYPCIISVSKEVAKGDFKTVKVNSSNFKTNFHTYVSELANHINTK